MQVDAMWRGKGKGQKGTVDGETKPAAVRDEARAPVKSRRAPDQQSDRGVASHALMHVPFRDLCRHCIADKAANWTHRVIRDEDDVSMVLVDYYFMNKKGDSDILTLVSCVDHKLGTVASCVCGEGPEV